MSLLEVKEVNQYYGGSHILRNVNLQAELGQVTVVLGRNGVGKTTLLKSLMGLVPIKSGSITLDGAAIDKTTPYERARAGVGYVPQGREIFGRLTVEENLLMGLAYKKRRHADSCGIVRTLSGLEADAATPGRRSVGRSATATGDCPGARGRPEVADPG